MSSEFGNDFITVTDEDGIEYELEHLDTLIHNGETYMAFATSETADSDEVEVILFHVVEEDGEELFESIDDDELIEEIYGMFMERIDNPEEFQEDNG